MGIAIEIKTIEDFRKAFPVVQATMTGRFGWRRIGGVVNMNACGFASERQAEDDRDAHFAAYMKNPSDFSR